MEAEPREVGGKAGLGAGDTEVRHQGKAEATADRRALDRADAGLLRAEQAGRFLVEVLAAFGRARLRPVGEIGAGAERLALGAQHVGADVVVLSNASKASAIWLISELSKKLCGGRWISTTPT